MAVTEAKRKGNDKYNAKCDYIAIKPLKAEGEAIRQAAKDAGPSLQGYILEAIRAKMAGDQPPEGRTRLTIGNDLLKKYQKDGETLAQTAQRLLKAGIETESKK